VKVVHGSCYDIPVRIGPVGISVFGAVLTFHLFSEPKGEANELVRVPLARIVSHVEDAARTGTGVELLVGPPR
jgi:hypothetical protein